MKNQYSGDDYNALIRQGFSAELVKYAAGCCFPIERLRADRNAQYWTGERIRQWVLSRGQIRGAPRPRPRPAKT